MMTSIYLPIADVFIDPYFLIGLGILGGFFLGMLGVGGSLIVTPGLLLLGVPPLIAVSSQVNSAIGTGFTGFLSYRRQYDVDYKLGFYIFIGGLWGALLGIYILGWVETNGYVNVMLGIGYVFLTAIMGTLQMIQSMKAIKNPVSKPTEVIMVQGVLRYVPWHITFPRCRVEMSILFPLFSGGITGFLTATLGIGNGILLIPIISYLIGRNSQVVTGTALFAGFAITALVTLFHILGEHPIDLLLVFYLLMSGVLGTELGVRCSYLVPKAYLGLAASLVILTVCIKFIWEWNNLFPALKNMTLPPNKEEGLWNGVTYFATHHKVTYYLFCMSTVIFIAWIMDLLLKTLSFFWARQKFHQ